MAWKHLDINDLRTILSEDETKQLNGYSLDTNVSAVINQTIDMVADLYRGAFKAKGYVCDVREHYIPDSYKMPVLAFSRHTVWTRFPNSENIALDERRVEEWEFAKDLLKDPYIGTEKPDWENDPSNPSNQDSSSEQGASIFVPIQRFPQWYLQTEAQTLQLSNYF